MKVAVIRFPGSNCDQDAFFALNQEPGISAEYVWHDESSLAGFEGVFIPGGFSYGDYLRCGAMASRSRIMDEVIRFAEAGKPIIGACNGFQILCEAGLLPGALLKNESQKFVCKHVYLKPENHVSFWTRGLEQILKIPIAHGEGRYVCDADTLREMVQLNQIAFRYVDAEGRQTDLANPNGSTENIAGVLNKQGNVLGLMPHPERACSQLLGSTDGKLILEAFNRVVSAL